ncbi:hypothetical protein LIO09_10720 [Acinetobacter soli]|nr:hypothetical protein [Acinetobacter soli]
MSCIKLFRIDISSWNTS